MFFALLIIKSHQLSAINSSSPFIVSFLQWFAKAYIKVIFYQDQWNTRGQWRYFFLFDSLEIPQIVRHNFYGQLFGIFLKKGLITCPLSMILGIENFEILILALFDVKIKKIFFYRIYFLPNIYSRLLMSLKLALALKSTHF